MSVSMADINGDTMLVVVIEYIMLALLVFSGSLGVVKATVALACILVTAGALVGVAALLESTGMYQPPAERDMNFPSCPTRKGNGAWPTVTTANAAAGNAKISIWKMAASSGAIEKQRERHTRSLLSCVEKTSVFSFIHKASNLPFLEALADRVYKKTYVQSHR